MSRPINQELIIFPGPDGLTILPSTSSPSSSPRVADPVPPSRGLRLAWRSAHPPASLSPDPAQHPSPPSAASRILAYGILGVLDLVHTQYLLAITAREPVAAVGPAGTREIFRVRDVLPIPLSGVAEAGRVIAAKVVGGPESGSGRKGGGKGPKREEVLSADEGEGDGEEEEEEEKSEGEEEGRAGEDDEVNSVGSLEEPAPRSATIGEGKAAGGNPGAGVGGVVRDVIHQQGRYGRFAERCLSRGGGGREGVRRRQGMSKGEQERKEGEETGNTATAGERRSVIEALTPRILRNARLFFSSGGFYFSYEYDLTRGWAGNGRGEGEKPLWQRCDPLVSFGRGAWGRGLGADVKAVFLE